MINEYKVLEYTRSSIQVHHLSSLFVLKWTSYTSLPNVGRCLTFEAPPPNDQKNKETIII